MKEIEKFFPKTEEDLIVVLEIVHVIGALGILFTTVHPIPYGRYSNSSFIKLTGWTLSGQNVWRGFCLTWLFPVLMMFFTPSRMLSNFPNVVAIFLFLAHYFYRSLIYPYKYMGNASPWPIESALVALLACSFNGFIQGFHLTNVYRVPSVGLISGMGLLLYMTGLVINITHDGILAQLRSRGRGRKSQQQSRVRQNSENSPGSSGTGTGTGSGPGTGTRSMGETESVKYSIPRGGLFEFISAANYFGEIVEWWGWALFTGGFPQFIFAITTTTIIGVRGWQHHQFYKRTYGRVYPANRKAIIPFIL